MGVEYLGLARCIRGIIRGLYYILFLDLNVGFSAVFCLKIHHSVHLRVKFLHVRYTLKFLKVKLLVNLSEY